MTITVVLVKEESYHWHPSKVGKYFKVIEIKTRAYIIEDCQGNVHDVFDADFKAFVWNDYDWDNYCKYGSVV